MIELKNYINDIDNDLNNFNLGLYYENMKHYSPASGFYLRCAEKTPNIELRYESLLRIYICYRELGSRDHSCDSILKQAVCLCPDKPEAYYFLCEYYENKSDWLNMYTYSSLGLQYMNNVSIFLSNINIPIAYGLLLKKSISSWKYGKPQQCRDIMRDLMENYLNIMNNKDKNTLKHHIMSYGLLSKKDSIKRYNKSMFNNLRYPFKDAESMDTNYSQIYQDIFVLTMLNGKQNGTYLEIGSSDPYHNNNTALLENKFAWSGLGIEIEEGSARNYKQKRKNPIICTDALLLDYSKVLNKYFRHTNNIDYLQIDIDPCENSYEVLLSIPFDKYQFGVITYEHDYYIDITRSYRDKSRQYLSRLGYKLAVANVSPNENCPFEDWWIHPNLVDINKIYKLICTDIDEISPIQTLLFI
jgi:tetratricopeptide (TPR) repeat protein